MGRKGTGSVALLGGSEGSTDGWAEGRLGEYVGASVGVADLWGEEAL
jgi:hypothetical protein